MKKSNDIIMIVSYIFVNIVIFYLYTITSDYTSRIMLIPFFVGSLCGLGFSCAKIINNNFLMNFFKICVLVMLILFFVISFIMGMIEG